VPSVRIDGRSITAMPSKPVIIVLDDMKDRIVWLRRWFDSSTHIVWKTNVSDFLEAVESYPSVSLIILDHDLDMLPGSVGVSMGPDGLTGLDATHHLSETFHHVPILVWSRNGHGAAQMTANLQKRGFRKVSALMYGFGRILHDHIRTKLG